MTTMIRHQSYIDYNILARQIVAIMLGGVSKDDDERVDANLELFQRHPYCADDIGFCYQILAKSLLEGL